MFQLAPTHTISQCLPDSSDEPLFIYNISQLRNQSIFGIKRKKRFVFKNGPQNPGTSSRSHFGLNQGRNATQCYYFFYLTFIPFFYTYQYQMHRFIIYQVYYMIHIITYSIMMIIIIIYIFIFHLFLSNMFIYIHTLT